MDKINKILYCVIMFFIPWLGKFLNGRIVPGIVQLVLYFFVIGWIIGLVEFVLDIINLKSDDNGEITIPSGFFDFLN
ncbi:MAG: hypothetical protein II855_01925 [Candidatus Methanomethylophilaceae archaeon]|nr:hypothetical protein [Candidatus Methanomethylophilaceae archaeon]